MTLENGAGSRISAYIFREILYILKYPTDNLNQDLKILLKGLKHFQEDDFFIGKRATVNQILELFELQRVSKEVQEMFQKAVKK